MAKLRLVHAGVLRKRLGRGITTESVSDAKEVSGFCSGSGWAMLPDSIPESVWSEFRAHRRKLKKPMTPYAEDLIISKLMRWQTENGANPIDIINHSIEMGWQGVFLNGYAKGGQDAAGRTISGPDAVPGVASGQTRCAVCNKPLTSGFIHSRKGRVHPDCL